MATAKKPAKAPEAKKPEAKKSITKSIVSKAGSKKPVPKPTIKPKQVKDLSQEPVETKENEMDILKQLLQNSPDRQIPESKPVAPAPAETIIERTETGIKDVYQAYQDPETGVGMNRQGRKLSEVISKSEAQPQRSLGSLLGRLRDREEVAEKPQLSFLKK